jgi:predicted MFS family arabinose efflux permease
VLLTLLLGTMLWVEAPFWLFAAVVSLRSVFLAMDPPVRGAVIPHLVPPEKIAQALALNTAVLNMSRLIGPAIAGLLLTGMEAHQIMWVAAAAFSVEVLTLTRVRLERADMDRKKREQADLREALAFLKGHPHLPSLMVLAVVPMVFGFPYSSMMPVFARDLLQLGPDGFGLLLSVSAAGALIGSLWLSASDGRQRHGRVLVLSLLGFGLSLGGFMLAGNYLIALAMMFWVGFSSQTYRTTSRIAVQLQTPDHLRGRIMSIALMDRGFIPLGALLIGWVAAEVGTLAAGLMMGAGCVLVTLAVFLWRREVWNV